MYCPDYIRFALRVSAKPIRAGHAPAASVGIRGGGVPGGPVAIRGGGGASQN